ncbi:MAG: N,N-dimethylformamidase beta subunit family domain-containing protein, partial [Sciscionella sp.]
MPRRWFLLLVAVGLLVTGCTGAHDGSGRSLAGGAPHAGVGSGAAGRAGTAATSLGSDGVRAAWVRRENARPGTTAWRIPPHASGAISGFADRVYAADGQRVSLYVSSRAPSFHVEAYRMGYYGGAGARLVWRSGQRRGTVQPPCPRTAGTNMVACDNWKPSLSLVLGKDFLQGDYLFKLVGNGGQQSYVPLTVWDPDSHAGYVVKNDVLTWQAWNPYGGYDYYVGQGSCPPGVYPLCSRARVVSFDRPYGDAQGTGDFLALELPLVEFLEQHGLDVSYATDLTLIQHPGFLSRHKALLSLGHDECWDLAERQAAVAAERHGMNIAFFGASPILRHVRAQPSPLGAHREVVDYRDSAADPFDGQGNPLNVTGNTWGSPPASWPESDFVGEMYAGFLEPGAPQAAFVVADATAWLFAGTGAHDGTTVPRVIASDADGFDPTSHPADLQILGHSPVPIADSQAHGRHWGPVYYSDMTYYTDTFSKAGVFDSGTNNWIPDL